MFVFLFRFSVLTLTAPILLLQAAVSQSQSHDKRNFLRPTIFKPFRAPSPPPPPYSVLHRPNKVPVLVDRFQRQTVFRGVNAGVEIWNGDGRPWDPTLFESGRCPNATTSRNQPPLCAVDYGRGKWNQSTGRWRFWSGGACRVTRRFCGIS